MIPAPMLAAWRAQALRVVTTPGEYSADLIERAWAFLKQHQVRS